MKPVESDQTEIDRQLENIRIVPPSIHGQGGFAVRFIQKGARVIEYAGERISKAESLRRCEAQNWFIFGLDDAIEVDKELARLCAGVFGPETSEGLWPVANLADSEDAAGQHNEALKLRQQVFEVRNRTLGSTN